MIVVLLVCLILIKICRSKFQFVSFWNHVDSIRFYLKIRLTKILHYEVFKVQRTFILPAIAVRLLVLCSAFVVTEHLISYHRSPKLSTVFRVFIKSFFTLFLRNLHPLGFLFSLHCFATALLYYHSSTIVSIDI